MRWWNCQKDSLLSALGVSSQAGLIHGSAQPSPDAQVWREFEFTSTRRSVEHLHPQTELIAGEKWAGKHLHALGNLCLVSHAMNSHMGNSGSQDKFKQLLGEKKSLMN